MPRSLRSLRVRIIAAFVTALATLVSAMVFLMVQFAGVSESMALITEGYLPLKEVVGRLERDHQRVGRDVQRLMNDEPRPGTGAAAPTLIYTEALATDLKRGRVMAQAAGAMAENAAERAALKRIATQLEKIDHGFQSFQEHSSTFVQAAERGDPVETLVEPLRRDIAMLGDEIDTLRRLIDDRISNLAGETERARLRATAVAGGLTGAGLLFSLFLIVAVLYALQPIRRLTEEVQRLTAGDYERRVDISGDDEVALLAREFNVMVAAIQNRDRTLVERADELNRLSRYLGSVLDSLEDALFVVEDDLVTLVNPAAEQRWGAEVGATPPALLEGLPSGRYEQRGPAQTLQEIRVIPFAGSGQVIVASDVTEQTLAKERLARSERLALIGQMLAQITHEVRNPLNALSLNVELLNEELDGLDPEKQTEAWDLLEIVSREIERLTAVTGHYLQLARRPKAQLDETHLGEVLIEVQRLLEAELETLGIRLELENEDIGPQLLDGNQIRQALLNVVRNAAEAGATVLRLSLGRTDSEIRLALTDNGPGMTEEEIARAFDPFFSTKASGTGLGLAITRQILEDHDGLVQVVSQPDTGTTVSLVLPHRPASSS